jgi:hypothetical protein
MYEVESFTLDGEERPPLMTDEARWRRFVVTRFGSALVQTMDDKRQYFGLKHEAAAGTLALTGGRGGELTLGQFKLLRPVAGKIVLDGDLRGKPARIALKEALADQFLLNSRGFHWIQEMPFNR